MATDNIALVSVFEDLAVVLDRHADNVIAAAKRDGIDPASSIPGCTGYEMKPSVPAR